VCVPQLGRVAFLVQGMPGFLKKLVFVLETVCGVVDRHNSSYVRPAVLTELQNRRPGRAVLKTVMLLASRSMKTPPSSASPKPLLSDVEGVKSALSSARDGVGVGGGTSGVTLNAAAARCVWVLCI
jgi:hypothetical protein